MNRQILFRGKSIENNLKNNVNVGDWVYGSYVHAPCTNNHLIYVPDEENENPYYVKVDKETICQLVGEYELLSGENRDVEVKGNVFEEDIIKICIETIIGNVIINGVVEWDKNNCCYMLLFPNNGESRPLEQFIDYGMSLLGNCIDNPELLKIEGELIERYRERVK